MHFLKTYQNWWSFLEFILFYFLERGEGREKERERNVICGCPLCAPYWEPGLQLRHMPWLGITLATLWFTGQHSIQWATPAKAKLVNFYVAVLFYWLCCYGCSDISPVPSLHKAHPTPSGNPPTIVDPNSYQNKRKLSSLYISCSEVFLLWICFSLWKVR